MLLQRFQSDLSINSRHDCYLLEFALLVLSFAFLFKLLNCGPDLMCWLIADAGTCVGARIVPAISNDAIATATIVIPIDCFL
jgi:hypothetical protein